MSDKNFNNTTLGEDVLITIVNSARVNDCDHLADAIESLFREDILLNLQRKRNIECDISAGIKHYQKYKFKQWCTNGINKPFQLDMFHELT